MLSISDLIAIIAIVTNCFLVILFTWLFQNMQSKQRRKKDFYLAEIQLNKNLFLKCLDTILQNEMREIRTIKSNLLILASQLAYNIEESKKTFTLEVDDENYLFISKTLLLLEDKSGKATEITLTEDLIEDIHDQYFMAIQSYNNLILLINDKNKLLW